MADEVQTVRHINWREAFPFTHLFRAFRIAVHPSKLVLGLLALLSLYCGGRILDGMWRPRDLAVPNEVYIYQNITEKGGSTADFLDARTATRDQIERAYTELLLSGFTPPIETDRAKAEEAARKGQRLGDVESKILENRKRDVENAQKAREEAHKLADTVSDVNEKDKLKRSADDNERDAIRLAYSGAYKHFQEAEQVKGFGLFHAFFQYETVQVVRVVHGVVRGNWLGGWQNDGPGGVLISVYNFFAVGPIWLMRHHMFYFTLFTLLFLTIWAIFGGAIARIAAVHVARDEKLSVRAALSFSVGKFLSFVSAPLIPLIIVAVVGLVPLIAGLLSSIPYLGPIFNILMGALFILILAAGFVMTLVLLGTLGGFNLMYPTIAVEGSDSFDAISRSFSYVYARPWRMAFYTLVSIVYGALTYTFVRTFIKLMLVLTNHFVGVGMVKEAPSTAPLWTTMWPGPAQTGTLSYDIDFLTLRKDQDIAAALVAFWVYTCVSVLGAFAISFYFSANTIIYYLMRREVDATEMDDVYLEQSDEEFGESPPVAGTVTEVTAVVTETVVSDAPPPEGDKPAEPPAT